MTTGEARDALMDEATERARDGADSLSDHCLIAVLKVRRPDTYLEPGEDETVVLDGLRRRLNGAGEGTI